MKYPVDVNGVEYFAEITYQRDRDGNIYDPNIYEVTRDGYLIEGEELLTVLEVMSEHDEKIYQACVDHDQMLAEQPRSNYDYE